MMTYETQILSWLIDSYERRSSTDSRIRKTALSVAAKYPGYREPLSEMNDRIESAIHALAGMGFIRGDVDQQGYYTKVYLIEAALPEIYHFLNRIPKTETQERQRSILQQYNRSDGITGKFCRAMLERLAQKKELEYGLAKDGALLADVLLALENIERLNQETYIRNFSEMVFHDSKRLQSIQGTIIRILMDYGEETAQRDTVLAQHNLISNPGYVYIKGDWNIWCGGQCISVGLLHGGIAISSDALEDLERITVSNGTVISVENLTTYHDTDQNQGAVIYLGGYVNTPRANLLKKLYQHNPNARFFHKGDLDPHGFLILEDLKKKTGIPFQPMEMDLDTLRKCHQAGHFRPLDEGDRKAMTSPTLLLYQPILQYMEQHNCKIEQECFEAMKLEQLVGSC